LESRFSVGDSGLGLGLPGCFIRQAIDCFALLGNEKHRRRIQSKPYVIWIIPGGEIYRFSVLVINWFYSPNALSGVSSIKMK
jgi:hypothetical protein